MVFQYNTHKLYRPFTVQIEVHIGLVSLNLHFADTLYDCKKHVKNNNSIFANWTALEKND